jgi:hypothetical protein
MAERGENQILGTRDILHFIDKRSKFVLFASTPTVTVMLDSCFHIPLTFYVQQAVCQSTLRTCVFHCSE